MRIVLFVIIVFAFFGMGIAFSEKGTYFDKVKYIQYSDDNTAIEEVKNGHLDIYYSAVPSDRLDSQSKQELQVFQSSGSSYSLLVNPATSEKFNPFSIEEVRFALNYLVNRDLIVDELLNGLGSPMISAYKPSDPDYLLILDELQSFNFKYNPTLADSLISKELQKAGAEKINKKWYYASKPIEITIFIRNDDPIRKSIGEIISSQLQDMGFTVKKDYGDLTKAFSVVYGSNPADLKWNLYTEGWISSGFVKYDSVLTAQMYSPWFSNMPGFNNPSYWNYQDPSIDALSQAIFLGNFTSANERADLIKQAVHRGIHDSVRIFLASKSNQFVANKKIHGLINDFGGGITSRFNPINARSDSDTLTIGVKKIYQGAWNPIAGFTDSSSQNIWSVISDPGDFKNPYTGLTIPVRSSWEVNAPGPTDKINVPKDAIRWNATQQRWVSVGDDVTATSEVTFHLKFGNWHDGQPMDMNDVLYGIYFLYQWGSDNASEMKTFDSEFSPKANQASKTLVGIRVIDKNTIEVYQNFWHFDKGEIADSAQVWPTTPWEIMYAMEKAVTDGKLAFSRSDSVSKNIDWLSLIVPEDANIIKSNLEIFEKDHVIPKALASLNNPDYFNSRYNSSISWIENHHHSVISNGPYYLENYSPEARVITLQAYDDPSYPLEVGYWKRFENIDLPKIQNVELPNIVSIGKELDIPVSVTPNSIIYYYFTNSIGKVVYQGKVSSASNKTIISVPPEKTANFDNGANDLQIFVISNTAFKPDIFHTSFLAVQGNYTLPGENMPLSIKTNYSGNEYLAPFVILVVVVCVFVIVWRKRRQRTVI